MSQAMRKLTAIIGKSRTILIFINQIRMKIGVMFGNPETTTGGNALKFYSSVRLEVRKTETIDGGKDEDAIGNRVRVKVVKNKVAPPFRRAELDVIFGKGVSAIGSLLDAAVKYEIIDKKGAWYSYNEEKVGQGREGAKEYLEQHPDFAQEVEAKLRTIIFPGRVFPKPVVKPAAPNAAAVAPAAGVSPAPRANPEILEVAESGPDFGLTAPAVPQRVPAAVAPPAAASPALQRAPEAPQTAPAAPQRVPTAPQGTGLPRGPGRPPAAPQSEIPVHRGPGRPPANPGIGGPSASSLSRPPAPNAVGDEGPVHRGPGRPRKAAPGEGDGDALF
ncbi:MAG: hypothetical protein LBT39_09480, partial [Treponema sp.]|jgi:recombination protein RecA|nr:hypothetical protein [Treponema sp.]